MDCPVCGAPVEKGAAFCQNCGTNLTVSHAPVSGANSIPANYKPLGPWAYLGYSILFAIPFLGLILLIVFSFNGSNVNRRNFARSYWCALLVFVILMIAVVAICVATGTTDELIGILQSYYPNV